MFNFRIFEKSTLDQYNVKFIDFKIKFEIFNDLNEFQKIGRMKVTKDDFYKDLNEEQIKERQRTLKQS